jgi:hypothetical protein
MFLGQDYRFKPAIREQLRAALRDYDADSIIAQLESAAEAFVVVKSSPRANASTSDNLTKLANAAAALEIEICHVETDEPAGDLLLEGLHRLGYDFRFIRTLKDASVTLQEAVRRSQRPLKRGKPSDRARAGLIGEVASILREAEPRRSRRVIRAALAKHGGISQRADRSNGPDTVLADVVKSVLMGVREGPADDPDHPRGVDLRVDVDIPKDIRELLLNCGVIRRKK